MDFAQTPRDIPITIRSATTVSERRVTPSWSISQFKSKLEHITGIPPQCQKLILKLPGEVPSIIEGQNEEIIRLDSWMLRPHVEIQVEDTRPDGSASLDFSDINAVPKYVMPDEVYESLPSSVLAWKKANKLGRFDPNISEVEQRKANAMWQEVKSRAIEVSKRCQVGNELSRRGEVAFVGEVPELPSAGGPWIGVILDEPSGKNDGSIQGNAYFKCPDKRGVFVRPDRVIIGDFPPDALDEDLAEL